LFSVVDKAPKIKYGKIGTENIKKVAMSSALITHAKLSSYLPVFEVNVSLIKKI